MNATAAPTRPTTLPQLPQLLRGQRIGAAVASVLMSAVLLTSVAIGLTGTSDDANQMAGRATLAVRA